MPTYVLTQQYLTTTPQRAVAINAEALLASLQAHADAKRNDPAIGQLQMTRGRFGSFNFYFRRNNKVLRFCTASPETSINKIVNAARTVVVDGDTIKSNHALPPKLGGGVFTRMSDEAQMRIINYITSHPQLCIEFVRSALNVADAEEVDEVIAAINVSEGLAIRDKVAVPMTREIVLIQQAGYEARKAMIARTSCPYADTSRECEAWLSGWDTAAKDADDANEQAQHVGLDVENMTPYHQQGGRDWVMKLRSECPHPTGPKATAWLAGWDEADKNFSNGSSADVEDRRNSRG